MRCKKPLTVIGICSILCSLMLSSTLVLGAGNSWNVVADGSGDFTSIQSAIDAASTGDTIYVSSGTYYETLTIGKNISLIGESKVNTTIVGANNTIISLVSDSILIQGFTVRDGEVGILIDNASNNIITNNSFINNSKGVSILSGSFNNRIYSNNFVENMQHAYDVSTNEWYVGSEGNYWDDYIGIDLDNNGIGDSSYDIAGASNLDRFPLMNPLTKVPFANFWYNPTNPTTQTPINFTDISYDLDGSIVSWVWDFGNNVTDTSQSPIYRYTDDGTYLVKLTVYDDLGASSSQIYTISVLNVAPTALFTASPEVPLDIQEVVFIDDSNDPDGNIVSWVWSVDNEVVEHGSYFSYTFPDDGDYMVSLEITDDDSSKSTYYQQISVLNVGPTVGFSFNTDDGTISKNERIRFVDNAHDQDGEIVSYLWNFGDGKTSTEKAPEHRYENNGIYKVSLTVTDDDGASKSFAKELVVGTISEREDILAGLSLIDLLFIIFIFIAVIIVFIISKKYSNL